MQTMYVNETFINFKIQINNNTGLIEEIFNKLFIYRLTQLNSTI